MLNENQTRERCGRYSYGSQEFDEFVADHDDMLVLVAAGNDGPHWQVSMSERHQPFLA